MIFVKTDFNHKIQKKLLNANTITSKMSSVRVGLTIERGSFRLNEAAAVDDYVY